MNSTPHQPRCSGFTLVEILVVCAMIAILAAIVLAAFGRVRESSRKSVCQNNLRQLSLGMQQYVQDHDGRFSKDPDLTAVLSSYAKSKALFLCPSDRASSHAGASSYMESPVVYQMIGNQLSMRHEAVVVNTATTILLYEDVFAPGIEKENVQTPAACGITQVGAMHFNGSNHAFVDGHVKWLSTPEFVQTMCDNIKELPITAS